MDDGTYGRHGPHGLDGVPFKISSKFRPAPKIIYQPVIKNSSRNVEEYTFETEEAVLAWARAREEAMKKASLEQAEKALKKSESIKKNDENKQLHEAAKGDDGTMNVADGNNSAPCSTGKDSDINNAGEMEKAHKPIVAAKPKKLLEPGAILKPTPIQHTNKAACQNDNDSDSKPSSKSIVDVSMFENAADPFDTLELQTLDDMEELKVLLDTASSSTDANKGESKSENKSADLNANSDTSEGFYDLAAPVSMDNWEKFDDNFIPNSNTTTPLQSNFNKLQEPMTRCSESPTSDDIGEYADISDEACLNPMAVNDTASVETTMSSSKITPPANLGTVPTKSNLPKGIYRPVLPPIPNNHVKMINGESADQSLEQTSTVSVSMGTSSVSFSSVPNLPTTPAPKPARPAPLPPTVLSRHLPTYSPNGSQTSSPQQSLTNSMEGDVSSGDEPITNPYSRHNTHPNQSDSSGNSQSYDTNARNEPSQPLVNQLNRYSPLPPAPAPKPKEVGLSDPYHNLSRELQGFVDSVTSMGFRRAKVARAVEKFGQDEKEVLDHLFAVDLLVEKKHAPINAEAALQSCKNDLKKAEEFLKLQLQLEQLGFSSDSVRDALEVSGMDHDKALDILTT